MTQHRLIAAAALSLAGVLANGTALAQQASMVGTEVQRHDLKSRASPALGTATKQSHAAEASGACGQSGRRRGGIPQTTRSAP